MEASGILAKVHHEGAGAWFAHQIQSLAQFYQKFEQLPPELHGGLRKGRTHLDDIDVQEAARKWLNERKLGTVMPETFRSPLNHKILPYLTTPLINPLSHYHTPHC